jgi:hypothetical protein
MADDIVKHGRAVRKEVLFCLKEVVEDAAALYRAERRRAEVAVPERACKEPCNRSREGRDENNRNINKGVYGRNQKFSVDK